MLKLVFISAFILGGALGSPLATRDDNDVKKEVCYDKYGCFGSEAPWTSAIRPLVALPMRPEEIQTRFLLYTRVNRDEAEELLIGKDAILQFSPFDGSKRTVFVIHGWTDNGNSEWVQETKNLLLQKEDLNVVIVDWGPGAKKSYLKGVGNIRLVGLMTGMFIEFIVEKANVNVAQVHLVGQSLGAHAASYAGQKVAGIGRITALDPTQPYFDGADAIVRIDKSDALFVEGIHTNGNAPLVLGLGTNLQVGHVDLYPNGGDHQPGCKDLLGNLVTSIIDLIILDFSGAIGVYACSHARVTKYWTESLKSECPFVAHSCDTYKNFENGNCYSTCEEPGSCTVLGYENENYAKNGAASGKYFLHTSSDKKSYCLQEADLVAAVNGGQEKVDHGKVTVQLVREDGTKSDKFELVSGAITASTVLEPWIEVPSGFLPSVHDKVKVIVHYSRTGLVPGNDPKILSLDNLTIKLIEHDLHISTKQFGAVSLEAGVDSILSEI